VDHILRCHEIVKEGLVESGAGIGAHFLSEPECLATRHKIVKEVRGRGLMIGMELEHDRGITVTSVYRDLLERGLIVGYSPAANFMRFYPPLTIGENDIARLVENLNGVLSAT